MYKNKIRGERLAEPLTKDEKKRILHLTRKGELNQVEIARLFRVTPQTVKRLCDKNGIGRWAELTPKIEIETVRQLRAGRGLHRVAKNMRLPDRVVNEIMQKYRIVHKVGAPKLSVEKRARIAEAVRGRKDYLYRLAKQFNVSRTTVRTIAREIAGVDRFIGWPNIEPLTPVESNAQIEAGYQKFVERIFQSSFSKELQVEEIHRNFAKLVESFAEIWCGGKIPSDRNAFIAALLESYMPRIKPAFVTMLDDSEYAKERTAVAGYLRQAVECAAVSRWAN